MMIEKFFKMLRFFWRETEIGTLLFVGVVVASHWIWKTDSAIIGLSLGLLILLLLYIIFWFKIWSIRN